jgi:lipoate-protein ligase B
LGVPSTRHPDQRGVWVGNTKLAFIGIAISRGVCWHGFALNVDLDLGPFDLIRPCGLEVAATSIARCTGSAPSTQKVGCIFEEEFRNLFRFAVNPAG